MIAARFWDDDVMMQAPLLPLKKMIFDFFKCFTSGLDLSDNGK